MMSVAEIKRRERAHKQASYLAAQKLDTIGMGVRVIEDDGQVMLTTLKSLPWSVAGGYWLARVEGKSSGFDCARITPAVEVSAQGKGTR